LVESLGSGYSPGCHWHWRMGIFPICAATFAQSLMKQEIASSQVPELPMSLRTEKS
jgi:hypothetical protein